MPATGVMRTEDALVTRASLQGMFRLACDVEAWPRLLAHYRRVRFLERSVDGGGVVEMAAWRPFGVAGWPTWWVSDMAVDRERPAIRYRHRRGITAGMEVEWTFAPAAEGTLVRIVHIWNGPRWPVIGKVAARAVIGPVFVHGIASRTLAGLAAEGERAEGDGRAEHGGARGGPPAVR